MKKKKKKRTKSTKTKIKFPWPNLNQGCPEWKVGLLTFTLTVLVGRDNYKIHIGKTALFRLVIYGGLSLSYITVFYGRCYY